MNGFLKMWYIHTMEYQSVLKKEGNPVTYNHMVKPGEHYVKWNKPIIEGQTSLDSIYMRYLR